MCYVAQILKSANNRKAKTSMLPLTTVCFSTDFEQTCLKKNWSNVNAGVRGLDITSSARNYTRIPAVAT